MRSKTPKPTIQDPNALERERVENEHFEKFRARLSVIVLTSTPRGRRFYRRIQAETIACAKAVFPGLVARVPVGHAINARWMVDDAMALANTMVNKFVAERLID
jgi:hypothetical protein